MTITSYAQNFEDVMLWRALSHVERGFYIDVGAQDPIIDSVSLVFHEHGWRGIHVEPLQHYADLLRQQRPGDTVIQAAVGNGPAVIRFFEIPGGGISTADANLAAQHRERGFDVRDITVPCITLSSVFDVAAESEIHWLKVDVEGFEQHVLESWGASRARPWIVVVESTLPLTQIETHEKWESILVSYGYSATYFDGLNRYYLSEAHPEVRAAFAVPPNIFDDFALNGTANAPFHRLIVARDQDRISETLALAEVQKRAADSELERLKLSAASQQAAHADRERGLLEQANRVRGDLEQIQSTLTQQEGDFAARLLTVQQQAALENEAQARLRSEKELELQLHHSGQISQAKQEMESLLHTLATREREFGAQLLAIQRQAALDSAEQTRLRSEKELELQLHYSGQLSEAKQEMESLLHSLAAREKEFGAQLLAIQQQAALESAEQARLRDELKRVMQGQLDKNAVQAKREMESVLNTLVQREREFAAQLLAIQEQSARERAEQIHLRTEQESAIRRQHAERERALGQQLQDMRLELRSVEQDLVQRESAHAEQINQSRQAVESVLNREVEREREIAALLLATQQQAHRESFEQATRHREQVLSLQSEHAKREQTLGLKLEATQQELLQSEAMRKTIQHELNGQLQAEREIGRVRQEALSSLQLDLAALRNSLSWRLTAPLRVVKDWLTHTSALPNTTSQESVITPPGDPLPGLVEPHSQQSKIPCTPPGATSMIRDDATRTTSLSPLNAAQDLRTLLQHQDGHFIQCAYMTVLKREPDPQGFDHYVGRLRGGDAKLQILSDLYSSSEAREIGASLPWLLRALRRHKLSRLPVIRLVLNSVSSRESTLDLANRLRILEQKQFLLEQHIEEQRESPSRAHTVARDVEADLSGMSIVAKRIFRELSDAVAGANGKR
jgi:FkbM family methyltransferase